MCSPSLYTQPLDEKNTTFILGWVREWEEGRDQEVAPANDSLTYGTGSMRGGRRNQGRI